MQIESRARGLGLDKMIPAWMICHGLIGRQASHRRPDYFRVLSPGANAMTSFSPAVCALLSEDRLPPLGPGVPNEGARKALEGLSAEALFVPETVRGLDFARACLAGLWLYHDFLDQAHAISQDIATAEGSFWHAIMHRREPDYPNAAYWFRKVGQHPVFVPLASAAQQLAAASSIAVAVPSPWNPFWFVDYCEACAKGKEPDKSFARHLQKHEWGLLFRYCYESAIGTPA